MRVRSRQHDIRCRDAVLAGERAADRFHNHTTEVKNVGGDKDAGVTVSVAQGHNLCQQRCQDSAGISLAAETAHLDLPRRRRDVCFGITNGPPPFAHLAPTRKRAQQTH